MIVMADCNKDNFPTHSGRCLPHPQAMPFQPDPQLGLTPERSPSSAFLKKTVRFSSPDQLRARRKVEMTGKENIGLSNVELSDPKDGKRLHTPKKQQRISRKHKSKMKAKSGGVSSDSHHHDITSCGSSGASREGEDNHLDRPELHTTLNLGRDILKLQSMDIDIVEAVKHRLTVSEYDRTVVKQKTYSKLNERSKSPSALSTDVSVNVPKDAVIERVERELTRCVKPLPARPKPNMEKPTLMRLFKPEFAFHRCVSTDQHGYEARALQVPTPRIDQAVFEHHDRISVWETE